MIGVEALHRIRMQNTGNRNPSVHQPIESGERNPATLAAAR
jgi:hypothetical protein